MMASQTNETPAPRKTWWGGTEPTGKITIEALAKLLGLPSWDRVEDLNEANFWEMAGASEIDDEDERTAAEDAARVEVFNQWYDAVSSAGSALFLAHDLDLVGMPARGESRPYTLRIVPITTWDNAADKIRETVNGIGYFHFSTLREFLASGPYTARRAVLAHLGWIKRYPDVYGSTSAQSLYERSWR